MTIKKWWETWGVSHITGQIQTVEAATYGGLFNLTVAQLIFMVLKMELTPCGNLDWEGTVDGSQRTRRLWENANFTHTTFLPKKHRVLDIKMWISPRSPAAGFIWSPPQEQEHFYNYNMEFTEITVWAFNCPLLKIILHHTQRIF